MMGSNLWSWHSAQAIVDPRNDADVVRTRSAWYLAMYSLSCIPPS